MSVKHIFIFFCLYFFVFINAEDPHVEISDGKLKGSFMKSKEGRQIVAFQGIPFAEPPLGELRFRSPRPVKPWEGVLDATQPHTACPQLNFFEPFEPSGEENCLFLNVYTPNWPSKSSELLPVMAYIHGGAFYVGSSNSDWHGPQILLDRDVILVTMNYRLGALGFLSTGDEASPGNYGLKDQSFALKWVKNNIKYFGGNPDQITIFGESAGAASSSYHMFSPLSKGLFKGVISQSGLPLCSWAFDPVGENIRNTKKLAKLVGCTTTSSAELVDCLRNVEAQKIIQLSSEFLEWDIDPMVAFKPVVEPHSSEAFLLDAPEKLLRAGAFEDVPWLIGITKDEGIMRAAGYEKKPQYYDELSEDFNNRIGLTLQLRTSNLEVVGEKIRKFYFGDKKQLNHKNAVQDLINMYTDGWFMNCLAEADRLHLKTSKKPLYNYLFAHQSERSFSYMMGSTEVLGVSHGDDCMYFFPFGEKFFPNISVSDDDMKVTKIMTKLWENFARTGNPTPVIDDLIRTKWEPIKSDKIEYYHIDAEVQEMKPALFENRVEFWKTLPLHSTKLGKKEEL